MDHIAEIDKHGPSVADREDRMRALELLLSRQSSACWRSRAPRRRARPDPRCRPARARPRAASALALRADRGDERAGLGRRLAEAAQTRDPATAQMLGDRYRAWVRRTPLLSPSAPRIRADHKIPRSNRSSPPARRR